MDNPNKEYEEKKKWLVDFLCDFEDPDIGGRDDAAMELVHYGDDDVVEVLVKVGSNPKEHDIILNSCGESLGGIWVDKGSLDEKLLEQLAPLAKAGVSIVVREWKPEWIKLYNLD